MHTLKIMLTNLLVIPSCLTRFAQLALDLYYQYESGTYIYFLLGGAVQRPLLYCNNADVTRFTLYYSLKKN